MQQQQPRRCLQRRRPPLPVVSDQDATLRRLVDQRQTRAVCGFRKLFAPLVVGPHLQLGVVVLRRRTYEL